MQINRLLDVYSKSSDDIAMNKGLPDWFKV